MYFKLPRSAAIIVSLSIASFTRVGAFSAQPPPSESTPAPNTHQQSFSKPAPLPATDNSHTLLGFDWISPPKDFAVIHRAYRSLARTYHPDVAAGPDATPEEREKASSDFARIKDAYEDLKARQDEEEIEVVMMGGNFATGKRDRRVKYKTSEKIRQSNPNRVNYDRILELRERDNLKDKSWRDPGAFDHQQGGRHNGDFGPSTSRIRRGPGAVDHQQGGRHNGDFGPSRLR